MKVQKVPNIIPNRSFILQLIVFIFLSGCSTKLAHNSENINYEMPKKPYVNINFSPKPIEEFKLENGLTVLFAEDKELPKISGTMLFKGGSITDSDKEWGATTLMGSLLRDGGTVDMDPDSLDLKLEQLPAGIGSGFGIEYGNVSFNCIKDDIETVFDLFSKVILSPGFNKERFELQKIKTLDGIERRKDDPASIASISFHQLLFDKTPLGRISTSKSVKNATLEDIIAAYKRYIKPVDAILAVSGDISRAELEALVNNKFKEWESPIKKSRELPQVSFTPKSGIYFVEGKYEQATIIAGQLGVSRMEPDEFIASIFNEIFARGESSLSAQVRTKLGLAYSVSGGIYPDVIKGKNLISAQTKAESAGQAIIESFKVLHAMQKIPPTIAEVDECKASAINSFIFANETPQAALLRKASFMFTGYPEDYDQRFTENIQKVTPDEVMEVARNRWKDKDWVVIVVGPGRALKAIEEVQKYLPEPLNKEMIKKVTFDEKLKIPN